MNPVPAHAPVSMPDRGESPTNVSSPGRLQATLNETVAGYISPVSLGLGILYAVLATIYLTTLPPPINVGVSLAHATASVLLLGLHIAVRGRTVPGDLSHMIGTGVALVATVVAAALVVLTGNAVHSTSFTIIVIGVGVFFLSWRWLAAAVFAADCAWLAVASLGGPSPYWTQLGLSLFSANVLAFLVHLVRMRTIGGLETLRSVEAEQSRKLERQTEKLREAQRTAHIGSFEWDITSGRVVWSDELYRLFGIAPGSMAVTYDQWLSMLRPEDRDEAGVLVRNALDNGTPFEFDYQVRQPDGSMRWIQGRAHVVADASGKPVKLVGTAQDITRRKLAEEEANRLNAELESRVAQRTAELEAANKELEAFSYSVSHDLRAPLMTVDGFSQALLEDYGDKLDDEGKKTILRVREATKRMAELIEAILKLSRLGRSALKPQRVNLSVLAKTYAEELHKTQPTRKVEVKVEPGVHAEGDPPLLRVVMENLIGNAWKFTSRKENAFIEFGAMKRRDGTVYFVRDDGAGFDPEYAAKLFLPFERLHAAKDFPGTGIGLASVKRIIDRHGGRVWADGYPGKGAQFYFTIGAKEEGRASADVQPAIREGRGVNT
ncbi:MAG: PAS domain-containing protein [Euryarchaeota archaeon]|nr:PAS domain-containing protein [Euryarchaeota archaeon]